MTESERTAFLRKAIIDRLGLDALDAIELTVARNDEAMTYDLTLRCRRAGATSRSQFTDMRMADRSSIPRMLAQSAHQCEASP
jgi:hypothetical protein